RVELGLDVGRRLAGERPALERQPAVRRVAPQLVAAFDERRVDRGAPEQRLRALAEAGVEVAERGEDRAGAHDRVDAEMRAGAVGGAAGDVDLGPDRAL